MVSISRLEREGEGWRLKEGQRRGARADSEAPQGLKQRRGKGSGMGMGHKNKRNHQYSKRGLDRQNFFHPGQVHCAKARGGTRSKEKPPPSRAWDEEGGAALLNASHCWGEGEGEGESEPFLG
jgi:hypothetical protein